MKIKYAKIFQSTLPVRGETTSRPTKIVRLDDFNPLSPRGERQQKRTKPAPNFRQSKQNFRYFLFWVQRFSVFRVIREPPLHNITGPVFLCEPSRKTMFASGSLHHFSSRYHYTQHEKFVKICALVYKATEKEGFIVFCP